VEGDPPLIDCPALTFSPTNVIARQSLRSGGRSLCWLPHRLPGDLPSVRPHALGHPRLPDCGLDVLAVVASSRFPRRVRLHPIDSPEGSRCGLGIILRPFPLCHVHPVGPPLPRDHHCWHSRLFGTVPRAPVGLRCPVHRTL
jgi:hypothetical protein